MPLSCYGARTGAGRNASPGAGRDGLRGDAHRFSHSRGIAGRAAAPTHRLVYADETIGGTASYAGGGYLFLRPPGGRAPTGRVPGGTPAPTPSGPDLIKNEYCPSRPSGRRREFLRSMWRSERGGARGLAGAARAPSQQKSALKNPF